MSRRLVPTLLVLAVAAGPLAAQPRPEFDQYRSAIASALAQHNDPAIQAELKLTDEQKEKLKKMPDDLLAKHKEAIDKEKAANKEAAEKAAAEQAEAVKRFDALLEKHLSADQRKRLSQLAVRSMGVMAFTNPEVEKALELSAETRARIIQIEQDGLNKLNKEFPNYNPFNADADTQKKYTTAYRKMTQEISDQTVAALTAEQKKAWKELAGEPSEAVVGSGGMRFNTPFVFNSLNARMHDLLRNDQVLTELKVEKPAREALADGLKVFTPNPQGGGSGPGGPGGGTIPVAVRTTLTREATAQAAELLTPSQTKRLEQVNFQLRGIGAFSSSPFFGGPRGGFGDPFATTPMANPLTKLTLTPAQVVKIDDVMNDLPKKRQEVALPPRGFFGTLNPPDKQTDEEKARLEESRKAQAEYTRKVNEIDQKALADITATFDAGQKRVWKELTGEPFDTTKLTSGGRGIGGGMGGGFGGGLGGPGGPARVSIVSLWTREASRQNSAGNYAAALATYDEAIRLSPTYATARLSKARMLSSCPSDWVRDGKQAVELMTKVIAETKEPSYTQYDVLAMAQAECGQFDEAVKAQQKALDLLPKPVSPDDPRGQGGPAPFLKPQYEERLKLYQEKKPYRLAPQSFTQPGGGR